MDPTPAGPDWAALYLQHRAAMYRTAASVLSGVGRTDLALDAVQDAITSLMASPPAAVENWEAIMVTVAKRRALDIVRSAPVRHDGSRADAAGDGRCPSPTG